MHAQHVSVYGATLLEWFRRAGMLVSRQSRNELLLTRQLIRSMLVRVGIAVGSARLHVAVNILCVAPSPASVQLSTNVLRVVGNSLELQKRARMALYNHGQGAQVSLPGRGEP